MRVLILSLFFSTYVCLAQSSTPIEINPDQPLEILSKIEPVYPPIAKAAHVSGKVVLKLEVNAAGSVTREKVISGPPMLVGAAEDAVRSWKFSPYLVNDQAVAVTFPVTVNFDLPAPANPNDEQIAQTFFPLADACIKSFAAHAESTETVTPCSKAAEVASTFSPKERFIERRSAYVYASTAYLRNKQPKEALAYADKALEVIAQGHDDGSGTSAAWSVHAQAEIANGNLLQASEDLTKAEDFERLGIKQLGGPNDEFVKHQYIPTLKNLLNFHAQVLNAIGQKEQADSKLTEAAKL